MVPELPIAMLACARLGAPHTVVFEGFSAASLADRLNGMECEVLVTRARRGAAELLLDRITGEIRPIALVTDG